jgi:hypothetical protein
VQGPTYLYDCYMNEGDEHAQEAFDTCKTLAVMASK